MKDFYGSVQCLIHFFVICTKLLCNIVTRYIGVYNCLKFDLCRANKAVRSIVTV